MNKRSGVTKAHKFLVLEKDKKVLQYTSVAFILGAVYAFSSHSLVEVSRCLLLCNS